MWHSDFDPNQIKDIEPAYLTQRQQIQKHQRSASVHDFLQKFQDQEQSKV